MKIQNAGKRERERELFHMFLHFFTVNSLIWPSFIQIDPGRRKRSDRLKRYPLVFTRKCPISFIILTQNVWPWVWGMAKKEIGRKEKEKISKRSKSLSRANFKKNAKVKMKNLKTVQELAQAPSQSQSQEPQNKDK